MRKIYFERVERQRRLVIRNEVTRWHVKHGWAYNVLDAGFSPLGVFFCTLLCGDGAVLHFLAGKGVRVSGAELLSCMRAAIEMILRCKQGFTLYTTIRASERKLIRVAEGLGFRVVEGAEMVREGGEEVKFLKFFGDCGDIVRDMKRREAQKTERR